VRPLTAFVFVCGFLLLLFVCFFLCVCEVFVRVKVF